MVPQQVIVQLIDPEYRQGSIQPSIFSSTADGDQAKAIEQAMVLVEEAAKHLESGVQVTSGRVPNT